MARSKAISDEGLRRALGAYAGMVHAVIDDPDRWLNLVDGPDQKATGVPGRVVEAVRQRVLGKQTPASPEWEQLPLEERTDWWVDRIGVSAGFAAAAPRVAGALADRVPLQAALGASAAGLAVCAVAHENGVTAAHDWVPLLASVLLGRELPAVPADVPPDEESESALTADQEGDGGDGGRLAGLARGAGGAARTLWRLARAFLGLQDLLDERPRGGFLARVVAKVPVVGVAGGWLDERGGIRKAAAETQQRLG